MVKVDAYEERDVPPPVGREALITHTLHYWLGASGARYPHAVYSLRGCPALPKATYILVRREADGARRPLKIGQTLEEARSLNLAHLRFEGARRGANEVHVHLQAKNAGEREAVAADLSARQSGRTPFSRSLFPGNDSAAA